MAYVTTVALFCSDKPMPTSTDLVKFVPKWVPHYYCRQLRSRAVASSYTHANVHTMYTNAEVNWIELCWKG